MRTVLKSALTLLSVVALFSCLTMAYANAPPGEEGTAATQQLTANVEAGMTAQAWWEPKDASISVQQAPEDSFASALTYNGTGTKRAGRSFAEDCSVMVNGMIGINEVPPLHAAMIATTTLAIEEAAQDVTQTSTTTNQSDTNVTQVTKRYATRLPEVRLIGA